ncbi:hypothetical protein BH24ACT26_BH24ACT26_05760 [soil metagenome]
MAAGSCGADPRRPRMEALPLNVLGLIVFIVGVLVTSGVSLLAFAYVYRRLSGDRVPGDAPAPG